MNREDKFSDDHKRMIKHEGKKLEDYLPVKCYVIGPYGQNIEKYMIFRKRYKSIPYKKFFFEKRPLFLPWGAFVLDDPELKIIENENHYLLEV